MIGTEDRTAARLTAQTATKSRGKSVRRAGVAAPASERDSPWARPHRKGNIMSSPHHRKPGRDPHPSTPEDSTPLVASAPPDEANRIFAAGGTPGTTRPLADPTPRFGAGCPGQALPPPPWYRRSGIRIAAAFAALIAGVGIIVAGPGEPGTAPGGTTGTSTPWSASFSLIATDIWEPPPAPPPAAPPAAEPPPAAPHTAAPPVAAPPPPPPSELRFWYGDPFPDGIPAFVSITNNANKPAVGCVYSSPAVAGPATTVPPTVVNFTVTGSAETRIDLHGPATGSTFHVTVTCDNGLSASQDKIY